MVYRFLFVLILGSILGCSYAYGQRQLAEDDPILLEVTEIYHKLLKANGDYRRKLPKLVMMDRKAKVASYQALDNLLIIELEAYRVCKTMGNYADDALAFLIGHELTHFYQKHDWKELGFAGTHFMPKQKTFTQQRQHEEEADIYGAFIAYLAGYNTLGVIPQFLEKLYQTYELDPNLSNYPSLKQRQAVAKKVQNRVEELIEVYEYSNYFMALGWHIQAVYGYTHLLQFVRTKELYNNLGMALLAIAIQQRSANAYWYPIELDMDHALRNWALKTESELLDLAKSNLLRAIDLDSSYATAWINLTVVYDLSKKNKHAEYSLSKANQFKTSILGNAKVKLLEGVLLARKGEKAAAKAAFQQAQTYTVNTAIQTISKHNLEVLEKGYSRLAVTPMTEIHDILDGVPLVDNCPEQFNQSILLQEEAFGAAQIHFKKLPNSKLACFELPNLRRGYSTFFVLQKTKTLATSKKIRKGYTVGMLRKAYDHIQVPQVIQHSNGYFMIYRSLGLIFKVNNQEKIEEWALFIAY